MSRLLFGTDFETVNALKCCLSKQFTRFWNREKQHSVFYCSSRSGSVILVSQSNNTSDFSQNISKFDIRD